MNNIGERQGFPSRIQGAFVWLFRKHCVPGAGGFSGAGPGGGGQVVSIGFPDSTHLVLYLAGHECVRAEYVRRLPGPANIGTTQRYMRLDDRKLADAQDLVE